MFNKVLSIRKNNIKSSSLSLKIYSDVFRDQNTFFKNFYNGTLHFKSGNQDWLFEDRDEHIYFNSTNPKISITIGDMSLTSNANNFIEIPKEPLFNSTAELVDNSNYQFFSLNLVPHAIEMPIPLRSSNVSVKNESLNEASLKLTILLQKIDELNNAIVSNVVLYHRSHSKFKKVDRNMLREPEPEHGRVFYTSTEINSWETRGRNVARVDTSNLKLLDLRKVPDETHRLIKDIMYDSFDLEDIAQYLDVDGIVLNSRNVYLYNYNDINLTWLSSTDIEIIKLLDKSLFNPNIISSSFNLDLR